MTFKSLGLDELLLRAIDGAGYDTPTPIQQASIPPALAGRDILACAQTGSGKTAAFCLPLLQRIDQSAADDPVPRALILTPTRELAIQIHESLLTYGKHLDLWHAVIFGGVNEKRQIAELRKGVDVLVATPGRLLDLLGRGIVNLASIELFVLDEADRMLDMGFIRDVRRVLAALPRKRQTLLFSATMPREIRALAAEIQHEPTEVQVAPVSSVAGRIEQFVCFADKNKKRSLLSKLLVREEYKRTLVFTRTKHGANRLARFLDQENLPAAAIHGNKSQGARVAALEGFKTGKVRVLVATDIAARGIDVEDVSHVVNFELPNVAETYVHRVGRTARAGRAGVAVSLCDPEERDYLRDIERLIRQKLVVLDGPPVEKGAAPPENTRPASTKARRGRRRPRPSSENRANGQAAPQKSARRPSA